MTTRIYRKYIPFYWNGKQYHKVSRLANEKGVTEDTVYRWLRRGYTCDGDVRPPGRPPQNEFVSKPMPASKVLPPLRKFGKVKRINTIRSKIHPFGEAYD